MSDELSPGDDAAASRALERISDADRERATELVQTALRDGLLGLDEIDERLGAVVAARTRGDLEAALVHLPRAGAGLAAAHPAAASRVGGDPTTINGTYARIQRTGRWEVPAHLVVKMSHSSLELDLMEAILPGPEILVEVDAEHSRLRLIVPDDIRVEDSGLEQHGSTVRIESAHNTSSSRAVVRLTGRLQWSRAVAGSPGWRRRRALRRSARG